MHRTAMPTPEGSNRAIALAAAMVAEKALKQGGLHLKAAEGAAAEQTQTWAIEMMQHAAHIATASAFLDFASRLCPDIKPK